ncbi:hypothetical protein [Microbispora sp. NBRC 16548]|uniref:hypothetical protein n=1 Tax=Microbispora sp. NBRC 16548 TaxID=3030994 RepID=UPI0024A2D982|nr:hypothetical protein [Microbispora sp. NBRC 16548]GLX06116.1 hypothetical protein Misp03_30430 [Microbispora sp. NBRC 16548]
MWFLAAGRATSTVMTATSAVVWVPVAGGVLSGVTLPAGCLAAAGRGLAAQRSSP